MLRFSGLLGSDTPIATFFFILLYTQGQGSLMEVVVTKI